MLAATDYVGLATLIAALGGAAAGIIAAVFTGLNGRNARAAHTELTNQVAANANTIETKAAELGASLDDVHAAVSTPPAKPPLGVIVADAADAVEEVKDAVSKG